MDATYDMHATISKAPRLEFDDVDSPITEVADAMAMVHDLGADDLARRG